MQRDNFTRDKDRTIALFERNGLTFSPVAYALLERYLESISKHNKSVNLFSRKETDLWTQLIFHSLSFLIIGTFPPQTTIIDIGTGGGIPGIPLACVRPDLELTLVDSIGKKIRALTSIINQLDIPATTIHVRAEELALSYRGKFDYAIARAVAPLKELSTWAQPLLRKNPNLSPPGMFPKGTLLALKGGSLQEEVLQTRALRFVETVELHPIILKENETIANTEKYLAIVHFK